MEAIGTSELVHSVTTVTDGFEHQAQCSCGWASEWVADDVTAVLDGVEHPEVAVGPPDRLDEFVSGLLDVQDDLAQVVMWMAENWSPTLPVPALPGSASRRFDLAVQCRDAKELAELADVLDVEVEADPSYEAGDATYRRARRVFGSVVVEAWRCDR